MTPVVTTAPKSAATTGILGRAAMAVIAIALTILWFALLAQRPLYDPDEGRYAEIPREMAIGGDWVVPHLNGLVYLEKPPLQYWLTALTFRIFGQSELTARLWTGLAGYASLVIVFCLGFRLWGFRTALRALFYTGSSWLFVLLGHQLTLDMLLSTFLLASLACYLMAELDHASTHGLGRARAWMLGCWASMALAVMTKGLVGVLVPAATLSIYALWQRDVSVFRRLHLRWGVTLFALIAVPWFAMAAHADAQFLRFFFIREHFQRFLTPIENRTEPWWYFGPVLLVGVLPWLPQAVRALALPLRSPGRAREFDAARILWAWCAFVLIFFSTSNAKLIPYILPAIPALALLGAASDGSTHNRRELIIGSLVSLASAFGILVYASGFWSTDDGRALTTQLAPGLTGTALVLAAAGLACLLCALWNRTDAARAAQCGGWLIACFGVLVTANMGQRFFSSKDLAAALLSRAAKSSPIFSVQTYEQSLTYYLQRDVVLVDYRDEFTLGLVENPARGIASLDQFAGRWRSLNDAYAVMPRPTRDRLLAMGLPMREIAGFPLVVLMSRN